MVGSPTPVIAKRPHSTESWLQRTRMASAICWRASAYNAERPCERFDSPSTCSMHSMYTRNMAPDIAKFSQEESPVTLSTDFPTCRRRRSRCARMPSSTRLRACSTASTNRASFTFSTTATNASNCVARSHKDAGLCSLVFSRFPELFRVRVAVRTKGIYRVDAKRSEHGFQTCNCRFTLLRHAADGNAEHLPLACTRAHPVEDARSCSKQRRPTCVDPSRSARLLSRVMLACLAPMKSHHTVRSQTGVSS